MLTQLRLRELYDYDPAIGSFKNRRLPHRKPGCINTHGYRVITIDGEQFRAARLVWLYMTGEWPDEHIDHINGNTVDDRWENIRAASHSENMRNTKLRVSNTSGTRGVSWNARRSKWHARVNVYGTLHHCGYFDTIEEAKAARDAKAIQLHGDFARFDSLTRTAKDLTQ